MEYEAKFEALEQRERRSAKLQRDNQLRYLEANHGVLAAGVKRNRKRISLIKPTVRKLHCINEGIITIFGVHSKLLEQAYKHPSFNKQMSKELSRTKYSYALDEDHPDLDEYLQHIQQFVGNTIAAVASSGPRERCGAETEGQTEEIVSTRELSRELNAEIELDTKTELDFDEPDARNLMGIGECGCSSTTAQHS